MVPPSLGYLDVLRAQGVQFCRQGQSKEGEHFPVPSSCIGNVDHCLALHRRLVVPEEDWGMYARVTKVPMERAKIADRFICVDGNKAQLAHAPGILSQHGTSNDHGAGIVDAIYEGKAADETVQPLV